MIALVDADTIYYRAAFKLNKKEVRKTIDTKMREIEGHLFMPAMQVAVKGFGNYRKDLYPNYKANRSTKEEIKPFLNYGHQYMCDKYNAVMADGMEADDLVAIWAAECRANDMDYVIAGIDKDLLQIPGKHLNYFRMDMTEVDEPTAHYNLMLQCLTGDNSDNIPGIKGIGPKKAERILAGVTPDRMWGRVRAAWRGHHAGDPELSRTLLTMLTSWEELDAIRAQIQSETGECKQDVQQTGTDNVQVS